MKRACLYQASGLMIIQACDVTLTINEKIISYETSMPVPGTQADDNRHAVFHLSLNKKNIIR